MGSFFMEPNAGDGVWFHDETEAGKKMSDTPSQRSRSARVPQGGPGGTPRGRNSTDEIDANLKRTYQQALDLDVPDRFRSLLAALKEKERQQ